MPFFFALITPLEVTVATFLLEEEYVTFCLLVTGDTAFIVAKEDVDECWEAVEETRKSVRNFIRAHQHKGTPIDEESI